jgi:hypothetical protein
MKLSLAESSRATPSVGIGVGRERLALFRKIGAGMPPLLRPFFKNKSADYIKF